MLTAYNGLTIEYDTIGNPTYVKQGETTIRSYTWEHGRELASMTDGSTTWTYTYDANGMRTSRSNGTTTYKYVYNGSSLTQMSVGNNLLNFTYDASGLPMSVTYNGTEYYYVTNLQGDVTAILNSSGTAVVQYTYDAWGNILTTTGTMASTLGVHNPLRYRGYVFDSETSLYYLQSRYYDPEIGRFLNADDVAYLGADGTLLSYNLFAYCGNNPVMGYDPTGHWDWELFGKVVVTTVIVAACLTGVGAIAAAAAVVTSTSVATAVTTAVAAAAVSTTCGAIDGAICAQKSGGDWRNGAMAGAIGSSTGALVSSMTSPGAQPDTALRLNTAGRVVGSLVYDLTYEYFETGEISCEGAVACGVDITMDACFGTVSNYYTASVPGSIIRAGVNGIIDAAIDVFQTVAYFS